MAVQTGLPDECVVEVPCYVDYNGISVPKVGDLPLGCAVICSQSVWVQRLAVEAAVSGDINLLYQAAMMDPLTGAVCLPGEIRQMVDGMLVAGAEWLPQYQDEILKAKVRMESPRYPYRPVSGFRLKHKTTEEMAGDKEMYYEYTEDNFRTGKDYNLKLKKFARVSTWRKDEITAVFEQSKAHIQLDGLFGCHTICLVREGRVEKKENIDSMCEFIW